LRLSLERRLGKFAGRVFKGGIGHLSLRLDVSNQRDGKSLLRPRQTVVWKWAFADTFWNDVGGGLMLQLSQVSCGSPDRKTASVQITHRNSLHRSG
jgi:hypothetical protein